MAFTSAAKWEIGIDEAGRGPLAGPVAVGVACVPADFDWRLLGGVKDSKLLRRKKRESIYRVASALREQKVINFSVSLIGPSVIDRFGINAAVKRGIGRALRELAIEPQLCHVKLDGLLRAPRNFQSQETIIGGDAKERSIGLASIVAKVTRDRYMIDLSKKYPEYGFERHKGYGTEHHLKAIRQHGLCNVHRRMYIHFIET